MFFQVNNLALRQKRQSFDLDELLGNSSPWPPVSSPGQNYGEDDREAGTGEWVDKVMVNRQEASFHKAHILEEEAEKQILKQQMIFERQNKEITV